MPDDLSAGGTEGDNHVTVQSTIEKIRWGSAGAHRVGGAGGLSEEPLKNVMKMTARS